MANRLYTDLHRGSLLRNHVHPVHRQYATLPDQHRHRRLVADRADRDCRGRWQTSVLPQLPGHRILERGRIGLPAGHGIEGQSAGRGRQNHLQQLDRSEQGDVLRDEGHLGIEHISVVRCELVTL